MNEYEKNVYTNLFEYPTKHIVKLELENEEKDKEIERLNNIINEIEKEIERERMEHWAPSPLYLTELLGKIKQLKESDNND